MAQHFTTFSKPKVSNREENLTQSIKWKTLTIPWGRYVGYTNIFIYDILRNVSRDLFSVTLENHNTVIKEW